MKKKFNINKEILVKLNEQGFLHWKKKDDAIYFHPSVIKYQKSIKEYEALADEKGYIKFQMWDFFSIFGSELCNGMRPLFETNIIINDSDLEPIED